MTTHFWRGQWQGRQPASPTHQRAREIVRPTGGILRGFVPSRKNGRLVHHEGLLERDAITLFEAHHRVAQYREQPITLQYPDGSRLRRYTPDFEVILETGEALLVEIKPDRSLQDPEVRHKLQRISEHLIRMGQPFVVLSSSVIRREPRLSNLRQILQQAPHVLPTRMAAEIALRPRLQRFPMALAEARKVFIGAGACPVVLLLMGFLTCELEQPLTSATLLHLTSETNHEWFRLSQAHDL